LSMARALGEKEVEELSPAIVELAGRLRQPEQEQSPINSEVRRWLLQGGPLPKGKDRQPTLHALAELALDTTARDRRPYFSDSIRGWEVSFNLNTVSPYLADKVSQVRQRIGPSLDGFVDVATTYFHDHTAPFSPADRAVAQDLAVILPLYSDGDEWSTDRTAAMLTAQLRAAYTDDPSQTVDTPIDELLPAKPWAILSQIVAINGEIPEFVGTATPKSKAVVEKLATLDRLLAGEIANDRIDHERRSLNGLLAEAPVETIRRLITRADDQEVWRFLEGRGGQLSGFIDANSFLNPDAPPALPLGGFVGAGFMPAEAPRTKETIDPLLLLAIFNDLTGSSEAQDRRIASLFRTSVKTGELGDQIKILLNSPLQSRKHAAHMLREMAAKTGSPELRERLLIVDPTISGAAAAEPEVPASGVKDNTSF
jgi:hypothetical protein